MLRLVLDTDVVIAALRSPRGASAALLKAADAGVVQLLVSVPLALEYEEQCLMPDHLRAAGLSKSEAMQFLDGILMLAEPVEALFRWRPQLPDVDDEMVLETAINGRATGIVTFNRRDFGGAPERFGVYVWLPSETIKRTRS